MPTTVSVSVVTTKPSVLSVELSIPVIISWAFVTIHI